MSIKKAVLRKELLSLRKALPKTELSYDMLNSIPEFQKAKVVFCYVSAHGEVSTEKLLSDLAKEKTLTVPYCIDNDGNMIAVKISGINELKEGRFGIPEPENPIVFPKESIDFVLVPGVAFSKDRYRLGYGKGYYDRFLANINPYKLGICKKELFFDTLPHNKFDIKMDSVLVIG